MKQLYLIRHAKSSWSNPHLNDFDRPLNKRGKRDAPVMAKRLLTQGIVPQYIFSSPAVRAKKTARYIAKGIGFKRKNIIYDKGLYSAGFSYFIDTIGKHLNEVDVMFMVGHNPTITELAEYLTGDRFFNVPTCGIVGIEYKGSGGFEKTPGAGSQLMFDFPKNSDF